MLLIGHLIALVESSPSQNNTIESIMQTTKPYQGPMIFHVLSNPDKYHSMNRLKPQEFMQILTEEDITEYIEGVGSNEALFMVS